MIRNLFLILLANTAFAAGPLFKHKEPAVDQEFQNIYHDVVTSASTVAGLDLGKVLQAVAATTTSNFSTTSATFVDTNLTASITPSSTSSRVLILTSIPVNCTGATTIGGRATITRGSTNICTATGCGQTAADTIQNIQTIAMSLIDSPSTTSATAYTVQGLYDGSGGSCGFGNGRTQSMILLEIGA